MACIYNRGQITIYVNGIQTNHNTTYYHDNSVFYSDLNQYRIGRIRVSGGDLYYNGKLNDFRIYDHALSPMEVKQISQGLILHYPLNNNGWGQENLFRKTGEFTNENIAKTYASMSGNTITLNPTKQSSGACHAKLKVDYLDYIDTINKTYTFSFDARENQENTTLKTGQYLRLYLQYTPANKITSAVDITDTTLEKQLYVGWYLSENFNHYERTFTFPDDLNRGNDDALVEGSQLTFAFYRYKGYCPVEIKNIKLEEGNKATPWSPNSTDNLANLLDINTNIEYDCSGYKNHGTKNGNFEYHSDTPKYNVDTNFNSSYIQASALPLETKTISFWVKFKELQSGNTYRWLFSQPNLGFQIAYSNSGQNFYTYCRKSGSTTGTRFTGLSGIQIGKWYHFVVIRKTGEEDETPNVRELYINGVKQTPNATNSYNTCLRSYLLIGARSDSSKAKDFGRIQMSDFRVYVTELSEIDILSLYHNEAYVDNNGNVYGAILRED